MQALFQLDAQGDSVLEQLAGFMDETSDDPDVTAYARHLTQGTWTRHVDIDERIAQASEHWSVDRMAPVDRSILRLAVFELMHPDGPPPAVVIDEAIELGKQFGALDSPQFVNGVLDAVRKRLGEPKGTTGA